MMYNDILIQHPSSLSSLQMESLFDRAAQSIKI
jgi:hypothetical protein